MQLFEDLSWIALLRQRKRTISLIATRSLLMHFSKRQMTYPKRAEEIRAGVDKNHGEIVSATGSPSD